MVQELNQSTNVNSIAFGRNEARLGPLMPAGWVEGIEAAAQATTERFEAKISAARSSMSKVRKGVWL
jgi:hypothetical protein